MRTVAVVVFGVFGTIALASTARAEQAPVRTAGRAPRLRAPDPSRLLAAGLLGRSYVGELKLQLTSYVDPDVNSNQPLVGFRYYFDPVIDESQPYVLQPFLQKASYAGIAYEDGPLSARLFALEGRYMLPGEWFGGTAELGYGAIDDASERWFADLGFDLYVVDEFAVEARVEFGKEAGDYNQPQVGVRFLVNAAGLGHAIEVYAGYRHRWEEGGQEADGGVGEVRYFFDKHVFVGGRFATDTGFWSGWAGYTFEKGVAAELEAGGEWEGQEGGFVRLGVALQF